MYSQYSAVVHWWDGSADMLYKARTGRNKSKVGRLFPPLPLNASVARAYPRWLVYRQAHTGSPALREQREAMGHLITVATCRWVPLDAVIRLLYASPGRGSPHGHTIQFRRASITRSGVAAAAAVRQGTDGEGTLTPVSFCSCSLLTAPIPSLSCFPRRFQPADANGIGPSTETA